MLEQEQRYFGAPAYTNAVYTFQIHFEVDVKVTQCPTNDEERIKKVVIYPASMKSDQLVLEIETVCECSCSADQATWVQ